MPALANPTLWRTHPQRADWYCYISNPSIVYNRRVNQLVFTSPVTQLIYDNPDGNGGSASDVKVGMTVRIKSSAGVFKGWARITAVPTATVIYISAIEFDEILFEDNDRIEVLKDYRLWAKLPRISEIGQPFKDYNIAYSVSVDQPPVAVIRGGWYAQRISGSIITVSFTAADSYAVADGATIASQTWNVDDGTITVGSSTSQSITATFPAGERWVSVTVTDTAGKSHTTRVLVVAANSTTALPIKLARLSGSIQNGWECGLDVLTGDTSAYPDGSPIILWADEKYGATAGSLNGVSGREHIKFCGWLTNDTTRIEALNDDWQITAKNAQGILMDRIAFNQVVEYAAGATSWFQMFKLTQWRYVHYLMHWHSTLLEVTPVERPSHYATYPAVRLDSSEGSLNDQLQFMAQAVRAKFTCDRNGICYWRYNPHLMTQSERGAATVTISLTDNDWTNAIALDNDHYRDVAMVNSGGIIASNTVVTAVLGAAPGLMPGQGRSQEVLNQQLVASVSDLLSRTGRFYALRNIPIKGFSITVANQGQIADPAWGEIIQFTLAATSNRRGKSFTNEPFVLGSLEVNFDHASGTTLETWVLEGMCAANAPNGVQVSLPGQTPADPSAEFFPDGGTWEEQPVEDWENYYPDDFIPEETTDDVSEGLVVAW